MEFRKFLSFLMVLLCCGLLVIGCSNDDDDSGSNDDDEGDSVEVIDEGETTPGNDDAVFDDFGDIVTSGGRVAFIADSNDGDSDGFEGIYTDAEIDSFSVAQDTFREVASTRDDDDAPSGSPTVLPGAGDTADDFFEIAIDNDNILFLAGSDNGEEGLYFDANGSISKIVDTGDIIPGGGNAFYNEFFIMDAENGTVTFTAEFTDGTEEKREVGEGVFISSLTGEISTLADNDTVAPGVVGGNGNELFTSFFETVIDEAGNIAFSGVFSDGDPIARERVEGFGIFTGTSEDNLQLIADTNTTMPGSGGNEFDSMFSVSVSEGNVAFIGSDGNDWKGKRLSKKRKINKLRDVSNRNTLFEGVYSDLSGSLTNIADSNTTIPDGTGNTFYVFGNAVIDGDRIVFSGADEEFFDIIADGPDKQVNARDLDGTSGIYLFHSGDTIEKLIDNQDLVPGSSDQTFRYAVSLDFEDDEINASVITSASGSEFNRFQADTVITVENTPSIVSFRTQKDRASTHLTWQTVCGEVLGFHVWRSSGEEYERITKHAIAPARGTREAARFSYTDNAAEGQSFYKLEIMKLDGTSEMIRPAYND